MSAVDLRFDEILEDLNVLVAENNDSALLRRWLNAVKVEQDEALSGESRLVARRVREHLEPMFLEVAS